MRAKQFQRRITIPCHATSSDSLLHVLDINECNSSPCSAQATCTNTDGSFQCSCDFGYTGDGFSCAGGWKLFSLIHKILPCLCLHLRIWFVSHALVLYISIRHLSMIATPCSGYSLLDGQRFWPNFVFLWANLFGNLSLADTYGFDGLYVREISLYIS